MLPEAHRILSFRLGHHQDLLEGSLLELWDRLVVGDRHVEVLRHKLLQQVFLLACLVQQDGHLAELCLVALLGAHHTTSQVDLLQTGLDHDLGPRSRGCFSQLLKFFHQIGLLDIGHDPPLSLGKVSSRLGSQA